MATVYAVPADARFEAATLRTAVERGRVLAYGVDPGKSNTIAIVTRDRLPGGEWEWNIRKIHQAPPDATALILAWGALGIPCVKNGDPALTRFDVLTHEHPVEGAQKGANAAWFLAKSLGSIQGTLAALDATRHPFREGALVVVSVYPSAWKAATMTPADKNGARARAAEVFGVEAARKWWPLSGDHDKAEAALLAAYGVLKWWPYATEKQAVSLAGE